MDDTSIIHWNVIEVTDQEDALALAGGFRLDDKSRFLALLEILVPVDAQLSHVGWDEPCSWVEVELLWEKRSHAV